MFRRFAFVGWLVLLLVSCESVGSARPAEPVSKQTEASQTKPQWNPAHECKVSVAEAKQFDQTGVIFRNPPSGGVTALWSDQWWFRNHRAIFGLLGDPLYAAAIRGFWSFGGDPLVGLLPTSDLESYKPNRHTIHISRAGIAFEDWLSCVVDRLSDQLNRLPHRVGPKQETLVSQRGYLLLNIASGGTTAHVDNKGFDAEQVISGVFALYEDLGDGSGGPVQATWFIDKHNYFDGTKGYPALKKIEPERLAAQIGADPADIKKTWREAMPGKVMVFRGGKIHHTTPVTEIRSAAVVIFAPRHPCEYASTLSN